MVTKGHTHLNKPAGKISKIKNSEAFLKDSLNTFGDIGK